MFKASALLKSYRLVCLDCLQFNCKLHFLCFLVQNYKKFSAFRNYADLLVGGRASPLSPQLFLGPYGMDSAIRA